MTSIELIGYVAAVCTTGAYLPQAIKVVKTGDTRSLSLSMYVILTFGVLLWFGYGLSRGDYPLAGANAITLLFSFTILILKIRNIKKDNQAI